MRLNVRPRMRLCPSYSATGEACARRRSPACPARGFRKGVISYPSRRDARGGKNGNYTVARSVVPGRIALLVVLNLSLVVQPRCCGGVDILDFRFGEPERNLGSCSAYAVARVNHITPDMHGEVAAHCPRSRHERVCRADHEPARLHNVAALPHHRKHRPAAGDVLRERAEERTLAHICVVPLFVVVVVVVVVVCVRACVRVSAHAVGRVRRTSCVPRLGPATAT